jgi:hypothetical protein
LENRHQIRATYRTITRNALREDIFVKQLTTLGTGLLLLLIGGISILGCSDTPGKSPAGVTQVVTTNVPIPTTPTPAQVTAANVQMTSGTSATTMIATPVLLAPPVGEQLSVPTGSVITFSGPNVSTTNNTLPVQQSGNGLVTVGTAVFAPGTVTMTLPSMTLQAATKAMPATKALAIPPYTLVLNSVTVTFVVTNSNSWTLPSSLVFQPVAQPDGLYTRGNQIVTAVWGPGTVAPSSATLGVHLYKDGNDMGSAQQSATPYAISGGQQLDFVGHNTSIEFNAADVTLNLPQ